MARVQEEKGDAGREEADLRIGRKRKPHQMRHESSVEERDDLRSLEDLLMEEAKLLFDPLSLLRLNVKRDVVIAREFDHVSREGVNLGDHRQEVVTRSPANHIAHGLGRDLGLEVLLEEVDEGCEIQCLRVLLVQLSVDLRAEWITVREKDREDREEKRIKLKDVFVREEFADVGGTVAMKEIDEMGHDRGELRTKIFGERGGRKHLKDTGQYLVECGALLTRSVDRDQGLH